MGDAAPTHVGNVQEAVNSPEVDERAKVRDVLHNPGPGLVHFDLGHELALHDIALFLDKPSATDHDISPFTVDLDDLGFDIPANELADVADTPDTYLGGRQEHRDADIHEKAALDLAEHLTGDVIPFLILADDLLPAANAISLPLREDDHAGLVFHGFEKHLDRVTFVELISLKFVKWDGALGFVAHVNEDLLPGDLDDVAFEDCADFKVLDGLVVDVAEVVRITIAASFSELELDLLVVFNFL